MKTIIAKPVSRLPSFRASVIKPDSSKSPKAERRKATVKNSKAHFSNRGSAKARKDGNAESHEKQSLQNHFAPSVLPRFRD
ncbi:MAG: hypothetical protein LBI02_11480 [Opitutaceae bacterium]|jgi:hypothetical protein|nr:hypothetical protein [Opitutaceae bacterium]